MAHKRYPAADPVADLEEEAVPAEDRADDDPAAEAQADDLAEADRNPPEDRNRLAAEDRMQVRAPPPLSLHVLQRGTSDMYSC